MLSASGAYELKIHSRGSDLIPNTVAVVPGIRMRLWEPVTLVARNARSLVSPAGILSASLRGAQGARAFAYHFVE